MASALQSPPRELHTPGRDRVIIGSRLSRIVRDDGAMAASERLMPHWSSPAILPAAIGASIGALISWVVARGRTTKARDDAAPPVTRLEAHMASLPAGRNVAPATSTALRRDVQQVFETTEATQDLEVLDRLLRDIRDLSNADEAIFWRWVEARRDARAERVVDGRRVASGVSSTFARGDRCVRWSAEEGEIQFAGDVGGAPTFVASPVIGPAGRLRRPHGHGRRGPATRPRLGAVVDAALRRRRWRVCFSCSICVESTGVAHASERRAARRGAATPGASSRRSARGGAVRDSARRHVGGNRRASALEHRRSAWNGSGGLSRAATSARGFT